MDKIPIQYIDGNFLIFSVGVGKFLRGNYNITGTLIGTLSRFPQQNIFLGIPIILMYEEVYLLVNILKIAYLEKDYESHLFLLTKDYENKAKYLNIIKNERQKEAQDELDNYVKNSISKAAKHGVYLDRESILKSRLSDTKGVVSNDVNNNNNKNASFSTPNITPLKELLSEDNYKKFCLEVAEFKKKNKNENENKKENKNNDKDNDNDNHNDNDKQGFSLSSLFTYITLQEREYFISPGLRFGGRFLAYPGDPLRFHSHLIVNSIDINKPFKLIDLVGGGRLGTNVKKAWCIGGVDETLLQDENSQNKEEVSLLYCIEWAGFG